MKKKYGITKPGQHMKIWYLDTAKKQLDRENWIVRYRYHEGCDFELTFKKRFKESEYLSLSREDLNAYKGFEPEIDMGHTKRTYSFSYIKSIKLTDELYFFNPEKAISLAAGKSPAVFVHPNGDELLRSVELYGPVEAIEYMGEYKGKQASIEIWKLGEYLTELSFKLETDKSEDFLKELIADDEKRLILRKDLLKTKALFDYYSDKSKALKG